MFRVGDDLWVDITYINNYLRNHLSASTLSALGYLATDEVTVLAQGELPNSFVYIRVLPKNIGNSTFNNGHGVSLVFPKFEYLEASFVNLTAARKIVPKVIIVFNNYPKLKIPAFHLVKIVYYSKIIETNIVELASIDEIKNHPVGISEELILPGLTGAVTQLSEFLL